MDNNDKYENSALRIFNQVRAIHERFIQSKILVENAKQHLSAQKNLTATQCKRATQSFFELDDSIGKLYNLLKQLPLPEILESQRHSISLRLGKLEQYKNELPDRISALSNRLGYKEETKNKQEDFIVSIQILIEQLDELISVLDTILVSGMSYASATEQVISKTDAENNGQEPLHLLIVPPQVSEPPAKQDFSSMPQFVLILIRNMLDILIRIFTIRAIRAIPPLDVPNATQKIVDRNPLPGIIVPIVATEVRRKERFEILSGLLSQHVEPMELERICRKVNINYQSLDDKSHETRAYSLTTKMENQGRLDKLEQELRILLPERFADENQ